MYTGPERRMTSEDKRHVQDLRILLSNLESTLVGLQLRGFTTTRIETRILKVKSQLACYIDLKES